MSSMSSETPILRRHLLLDLLSVKHYLAKKKLSNDELAEVQGLVWYAQLRAIRLMQRGDDWRNHKVRSKHYQGKLGDLFDEFKEFHAKDMVQV